MKKFEFLYHVFYLFTNNKTIILYIVLIIRIILLHYLFFISNILIV